MALDDNNSNGHDEKRQLVEQIPHKEGRVLCYFEPVGAARLCRSVTWVAPVEVERAEEGVVRRGED